MASLKERLMKESQAPPRKTKAAQTKLSESEAVNLAEQVFDEMLDFYQSQAGWIPVAGQGLMSANAGDDGGYYGNLLDEEPKQRIHYVKRSRVLARREPTAKQAVRLYTTYLGIQKVEFKCEEDDALKVWKDQFWNLPENRRILSNTYRRRLSMRLLTDGELFLILFVRTDGTIQVRLLDCLQIEGMITHPEDNDLVLFYKRVMPQKGSNASKTIYYRDIYATSEVIQEAVEAGLEVFPDDLLAEFNLPEGTEQICIYHLPFDTIGIRGNGLLFGAISYIDNLRNFLQDRATIVRGLSTYIRNVTVKGGSLAVKDLAAQFRSSLTNTYGYGGLDRNPPDTAGSTWVQNQNVSKQETPPITNAGEAMTDNRIFRQPIASFVGITEANLIGDPSISSLASQEQMEGPQLQNFLDYQQMWEEAISELWKFTLEVNGVQDVGEVPVDVDFPPIIKINPVALAQMLPSAMEAKLITHEESIRTFLISLGSDNIDSQIEALVKQKEEADEQMEMQMQQEQGGYEEEDDGEDLTDDELATEEEADAAGFPVEESDWKFPAMKPPKAFTAPSYGEHNAALKNSPKAFKAARRTRIDKFRKWQDKQEDKKIKFERVKSKLKAQSAFRAKSRDTKYSVKWNKPVTIKQDSGQEDEERCSFCESTNVQEEHGVSYCNDCEQTYVPRYGMFLAGVAVLKESTNGKTHDEE